MVVDVVVLYIDGRWSLYVGAGAHGTCDLTQQSLGTVRHGFVGLNVTSGPTITPLSDWTVFVLASVSLKIGLIS